MSKRRERQEIILALLTTGWQRASTLAAAIDQPTTGSGLSTAGRLAEELPLPIENDKVGRTHLRRLAPAEALIALGGESLSAAHRETLRAAVEESPDLTTAGLVAQLAQALRIAQEAGIDLSAPGAT